MRRIPLLSSAAPGGNAGFTLLELLAVVAIIGLLAAFLVPTATGMIEQGRSAKCLGNLRTLIPAFHQFAADNNGRLPVQYAPSSSGSGSESGNNTWNLQIKSYVFFPKDPLPQDRVRAAAPAFFCPSCSSSWATKLWFNPDYGVNGRMIVNAGTGNSAMVLASVPRPAKMALVGDLAGVAGNPLNSGDGYSWDMGLIVGGAWQPPATASATRRNDLAFRHPPSRDSLTGSAWHVGFLDGHVESVKQTDPRLQTQQGRREMFDPTSPP
jgi:prepilin-type N-terminal cleavage/methylation domain-containing protein